MSNEADIVPDDDSRNNIKSRFEIKAIEIKPQVEEFLEMQNPRQILEEKRKMTQLETGRNSRAMLVKKKSKIIEEQREGGEKEDEKPNEPESQKETE